MRRYATLALVAVVASTAACAEILGLRPADSRPFPHSAHLAKGVGCIDCHKNPGAVGELPGFPAKTTCTSAKCHASPHDKDHACRDCHGSYRAEREYEAVREHLNFDHSKHKRFANRGCVQCHADIRFEGTALRWNQHRLGAVRMATCGTAQCHEAEQAGAKAKGGEEPGITHADRLARNRCEPCHNNLHEDAPKPEDHNIHAGNFLREHGQRAAADRAYCSTCHQERFCTSCHGVTVPGLPERLKFDDPRGAGVHRAGFKSRHSDEAKADPGMCTTCHQPRVCQDCHDREKLTPAAKRTAVHPRGWIGPPGAQNDHGRASWRDPEICASCHGGAGEQLCVGCHKSGAIGGNPHPPGFHSKRAKTVDRTCRMCHVPM